MPVRESGPPPPVWEGLAQSWVSREEGEQFFFLAWMRDSKVLRTFSSWGNRGSTVQKWKLVSECTQLLRSTWRNTRTRCRRRKPRRKPSWQWEPSTPGLINDFRNRQVNCKETERLYEHSLRRKQVLFRVSQQRWALVKLQALLGTQESYTYKNQVERKYPGLLRDWAAVNDFSRTLDEGIQYCWSPNPLSTKKLPLFLQQENSIFLYTFLTQVWYWTKKWRNSGLMRTCDETETKRTM